MSFSAHVTGTPGPVWHYGHVQGLGTHLTSEVLEITLNDYSASIAIAYCKTPTVRHHLPFICSCAQRASTHENSLCQDF